MFAKVAVLALALAVCNGQILSSYNTGHGLLGAGLGVSGIPVYRSSAHYGGLYGANGLGYGANLGRVAGLGALRTTGGIIGSGALGYGTGALVAGAPAIAGYGVRGLGIGGLGVRGLGVSGLGVSGLGVSGLGVGGLGVSGLGIGGLNIARGLSVHQAGPVNAAVHTLSRTVDYRAVPYAGEPATVQDIDVGPQESPLRINFQSKSSPLAVTQQHIPAEPGQVQVTHSEDEPQTAIHNVNRPVVQQVNEVVQPYRSLTQTVEPVIEQTHTNIAQGEGIPLTGLTTGVVGGTGVLGASGVGVAGLGIGGLGVSGLGLRTAGLGIGGLGVSGLGLRTAGLGGVVGGYGLGGYGTAGLGGYGLGGYRTAGLGGVVGLGGIRSAGLYGSGVYGSGLGSVYGSGLYGGRSIGYGSGLGYGGYGYGSGIGLNGLSGLSTYGTTARIARF